MTLSAEIISRNYRQSLALATQLIAQTKRNKGFDCDSADSEVIDLAQTVLGTEQIVQYIKSVIFSETTYKPLLNEAIETCRKEFFPDVRKKRFVALEDHHGQIPDPALLQHNQSSEQTTGSSSKDDGWSVLQKQLDPQNGRFLKQLLHHHSGEFSGDRFQSLFALSNGFKESDTQILDQKIEKLRQHYLDGRICDTSQLDGRNPMDKSLIREVFKNVYFGLERRYPPFFLTRDARKRAAIMTRYLIEEILSMEPPCILQDHDETFFIRHKLANVYRLFNYSANRALGNAYPQLIPPWLSSRTADNYWEGEANRLQAIRWLVEKRLQLNVQTLYKCSLSRKDFTDHGLSYMFNRYYNSVSKALLAAYPHLQPWETGPVPLEFWSDQNAAAAVRWLIEKQGWVIDDLPRLAQQKVLHRKTFSDFGLATLFEKKFSRNMYAAINLAFPGKFSPWEFGKVSRDYWNRKDHIWQAAHWIARREGIAEHQITRAVRTRRLNGKILQKYSIGAALRRLSRGCLEDLFMPFFWKEQQAQQLEARLIHKWQKLLRREQQGRHLGFYLLFGFFAPLVQANSDEDITRYERKIRRLRRYQLLAE